jgi:hypothetical protein
MECVVLKLRNKDLGIVEEEYSSDSFISQWPQ